MLNRYEPSHALRVFVSNRRSRQVTDSEIDVNPCRIRSGYDFGPVGSFCVIAVVEIKTGTRRIIEYLMPWSYDMRTRVSGRDSNLHREHVPHVSDRIP
jgi:hypothetical protein